MSTLVQVLLFAFGAAVAAAGAGMSEESWWLAAGIGALVALRLHDARRIRRLEARAADAASPPGGASAVDADRPAPALPDLPAEPGLPLPERPVGRTPRRPRRPTRRPDVRLGAERPPADAPDTRAPRGPKPGSVEATLNDGIRRAVAFVTGGNPVARVALLVVFVGVGLFVRYAAEQGFFPIEVRLLATSLAGLAFLATGWRLRKRAEGLGLTLQGGGVAILYLTIYAAYAYYALLPSLLAIGLMAVVAIGCGALAVVQDAPALALIGVLGGFMAPVLAGTDAGNHVLLFSYYTALNVGVLGIAWVKGWRSLALLGFACTYLLGGLWGGLTYRPELYATTQPFLIAWFAIYFALSIHFARRAIRAETPPERVLVVDGTLVFGLPAATFVLQNGLVEAVPYGDAWSAAALAGVYLAACVGLSRQPGVRLLADAFLAVGLTFATLALPLAFQRVLVGALWVLEGAALVWTGARQRKAWMRWGGLALQLAAAAVLFRQGVLDPGEAFGPETLTGWIVAVALGLSAYVLYRDREVAPWERLASRALLVAGLLWWAASGWVHTFDLLPDDRQLVALVGFAAASAAALLAGGRALAWPAMRLSAFGLVPVGFLLFLASLFWADHPFGDGGWLGWPLALAVAVGALAVNRSAPAGLHTAAAAATLWLVTTVTATELAWQLDARLPGSGWAIGAFGAVLALALVGPSRVPPPLVRRVASARGLAVGAVGIGLAIVGWMLGTAGVEADATPLRFLPVLNPAGLAALATLGALGLASGALDRPDARRLTWGLTGALGFVALTVEVARSVHHLAGVAYTASALFASATFQAAIAIAWTALALVLTVGAVRRESRPMWIVGAALLMLVVLKLFFVDLSQTDSLVRIGAFLGVGLLGLWIAYQAPLPPKRTEAPDPGPDASPMTPVLAPPSSDDPGG